MAPEESDESARSSSSDEEDDSEELDDDDDVKAELESESKSRKMCSVSTAAIRPAKEEIFRLSTWFCLSNASHSSLARL